MNSTTPIDPSVVRPLSTNPLPVNKQAARIFWKAPWWAKLPLEDKEALIRIPARIEDLINTTNAPPERPGNKHNQIQDRRGHKMKNKHGLVVLIIGYAYCRPLNPRNVKRLELWHQGHNWCHATVNEKVRAQAHFWYAFSKGQIIIICTRNSKWKMAGNYEPLSLA